MLEFLSNNRLAFDYYIFVDAFDVALVGDASDVIERFEKYHADMVTCNTDRNIPVYMEKEGYTYGSSNWPHIAYCTLPCRHFEKWVSRWSRRHFHLNSGGIMVRADRFGFYLPRMMEGYRRSVDESLNL